MSTVLAPKSNRNKGQIPSLESGDHLTQAEFHRRYRAYQDHVKFELIGGIVYMASPASRDHGLDHVELIALLAHYKAHTPGVEALDNGTVILDEAAEPQPDVTLRILSEYGGRSDDSKDKYLHGGPELVAEVAASSISIDLFEKKDDYRRAGVEEYLVLCVAERALRWFVFKPRSSELKPDGDGVFKSRVFPGLWIDGPNLLARNTKAAIETLQRGLASPEHAAFVQKLQAAAKRRK